MGRVVCNVGVCSRSRVALGGDATVKGEDG